jgi:hypothetical protein
MYEEENIIRFTYMKTPLYRLTFKNSRIRRWVEENVEGKVLNLFAGDTKLNCDEVRNDIRMEANATFHMDALEFVNTWNGVKFSTVLLDPPYSLRKSMTKYNGAISSPFNQIKNQIPNILEKNGIVLTFGYQSNSMGKSRGFKQEHILLMSHGGAIHDTICIKERMISGLSREEIGIFF